MAGDPEDDVTIILNAASAGDRQAAEALIPLVDGELRYFVGMTIEETAEALEISTPTAKRDWSYARAWRFRELKRED